MMHNSHSDRLWRGLNGRAGRRLVALAVCLALLAGLFPLLPDAEAGNGVRKRLDSVVVHPAETPKASEGTAVQNTYILEVSTGSVRGGGCAECVQYFVVYYTCGSVQRSAVIFPGNDGRSYGMDKAAAVASRDERRQEVQSTFGYTTDALQSRKGLASVQTDQFLFTAPEPITSIDRIQVFGKRLTFYNEDDNSYDVQSDWSCQGMRVYRVDTLYGLEMYGWYSDLGYIDFDGQIIADVVMAIGGGIFRWQNSGGVFNIGGPDDDAGVAGVTLVNTLTAPDYEYDNFVGLTHSAQASNQVLFRLDLADDGGAGFESLAGSYEAGSESTIQDLQFCETGSVKLRYVDIYGCIREVDLPLIINSLGWTMEQVGNVAIAGFGQQGESIPFSAMLPDFQELSSLNIGIGEELARREARLRYVAPETDTIRAQRVQKANEDNISYVCFAGYREATVEIQTNTAALEYVYTPGSKEPWRYYVSGGVEGVPIEAGADSTLTLMNYIEGLTLTPVDRQERFLLTISTDNVANAGTTADIYLKFTYLSMRDKETESPEFRLQDYVQEFYGEWPGNTDGFAYKYGLRTGGTIQCMIPIQGVKQFKNVSIRIDGEDEWQFKGLQIQMVRSYEKRSIAWQEIDEEGYKSHLLYGRPTNSQGVCFQVGTVYSEDSPALDPSDPEWEPGNLIQDDHNYHTYDGKSREVTTEDEIDWAKLRLFMTYENALLNLGFNRKRCIYEVEVNVAGDKVNSTDDDCGSANLFYFQLVFEYGNSGCVLANQQLSGDAFRTGAKAVFTIPTTQDYGNLTAIRIIPDDQDSNGDIYDKLKISSITVRKQNTGKISPTWTADSDSADGLGWVGIDYRDPGAVGSNRGAEGRSITEIAHTYQINKTSYSTKLLISITTGSYATTPKTNAQGETVIIEDPVLQGGMSMSFNYYDRDGRVQHVDPVDIVHLMNEYSGTTDSKVRSVDNVVEEVNYTVSNPDYNFRPSTTDNFYIDVDNISQIIDMQLQIRSSVVTKWNIQNVSVYLVQGEGTRFINANGEYDYKYPEGQELSLRATWTRTQNLVKDVQIYRTLQKNSIGEVNITFTKNEFPLDDDAQWNSYVAREPNSKDDEVNIFLYPSTENAATTPGTYDLFTDVLYTSSMTHNATRISTGEMNYTTDSSGKPVYYALGLSTSYLESISGLEVSTNSLTPIHAPISYGIVQIIRSGVLIDSFYFYGLGNADTGVTLKPSSDPGGQSIQRVLLQVDKTLSAQDLKPEEKDLAVALYFTTDDAFGGELRSKYIFLTDQGYTDIKPGEVLELDFNINNIKEIVGLNLVTMGRLEISFENGLVLNHSSNGVLEGKWSFQGKMTPTRNPSRFSVSGDVSLLDISLTTAENDGAVTSGTTGPVRMVVGYYDRTGVERSRTYENLRVFTDSERAFYSGSTDNVRILVANLAELRWMQLEPLADPKLQPATEGGTVPAATWKVQSLSVMKDLSGLPVARVLNQLIVQGTPVKISMAEMLLTGIISTIRKASDTGSSNGDYTIPTNGELGIALNPGEGVRIVPRLSGSTQGDTVVLNRLDPATGGLGRAELVDTRGYTVALLESYAQNAGPEEAAVWRSVVPDNGTWNVKQSSTGTGGGTATDYIVFMPPRNYTGSAISYRVTITSKENPAICVTIDLTVPTEVNPVTQLVSDARARDQAQSAHTHTLTFQPAIQPTCTDPGQAACYLCTSCGKYFNDVLGENEVQLVDLVLQAKGHTETVVYENITDSTHEAVTCCSVCGEEFSRTTENHSYGDWTDSEDGTTQSRVCSGCGHTETRAKPEEEGGG